HRQRSETKVIRADTGKAGLMTPRTFKRQEVERFVFLQRAAEREAALYARIRRVFLCGERIHGLNLPVAQISECRSMKCIRSRPCNDVDDSSRCPSVLGSVAVRHDL